MTILYCVTIQNKRVDFLKTLYLISFCKRRFLPFEKQKTQFSKISKNDLKAFKEAIKSHSCLNKVECEIIIRDVGYNKYLMPLNENENILTLTISLFIREIFKIDEINEVFCAKVDLRRRWFDKKLKFKNLHQHSQNILNEEELGLN